MPKDRERLAVAHNIQPLGHVGNINVALDDVADHAIHRRLVFFLFKVGADGDGLCRVRVGQGREALFHSVFDVPAEAREQFKRVLGLAAGGEPHALFMAILDEQ